MCPRVNLDTHWSSDSEPEISVILSMPEYFISLHTGRTPTNWSSKTWGDCKLVRENSPACWNAVFYFMYINKVITTVLSFLICVTNDNIAAYLYNYYVTYIIKFRTVRDVNVDESDSSQWKWIIKLFCMQIDKLSLVAL